MNAVILWRGGGGDGAIWPPSRVNLRPLFYSEANLPSSIEGMYREHQQATWPFRQPKLDAQSSARRSSRSCTQKATSQTNTAQAAARRPHDIHVKPIYDCYSVLINHLHRLSFKVRPRTQQYVVPRQSCDSLESISIDFVGVYQNLSEVCLMSANFEGNLNFEIRSATSIAGSS